MPVNFNSLKNFLHLFCTTSSIHGLNHLVMPSRHIIERIWWFIFVVLALYGTVVISSLTLRRYIENPTVISVERDKNSWNTTFPAATICPLLKINQKMMNSFIDQSNVTNKILLRRFLSSLIYANYEDFETVVEYDEISPDEYLRIILDLNFHFNPVLANSEEGTTLKRPLKMIITEMGLCYVYNSNLAIYNTPSYWEKNRWDLVEWNEPININPLDGEIFSNLINISTGINIYFHGPFEMADIASKKYFCENGHMIQMYLHALTLFSSPEIKHLHISQRKCRFYYESELERSPAYSYVLCRTDCRAGLAKKLCGCLPHFYRRKTGEKICDVKGLHCLAKHKEVLILLRDQCKCLPNCDEVNYNIDSIKNQEWWFDSNIQFGLRGYPNMRLRRDVIFGFSDLLVYIGGMAGLFLGCSVLSFIEILYFFTLRLYLYSIKYKK